MIKSSDLPESLRMPSVHLLSDLHLLQPDEPFYQRILRWLDSTPQPGDEVALAGDIFDVYVGNKTVFARLHAPFFSAVQKLLASGIRVHHVEGNHDFWLREAYVEQGCGEVQVHGDFIEISMEGRSLRVEHGDLADPRDALYLRLRKAFRSRIGSALIAAAPGAWLDRLGRAWSNGSRDRQGELPDTWPEARLHALREVYFAYARTRVGAGRADALVMGHCHDAHACEGYMNVGFPRKHLAWVRWTPGRNLLERVPFEPSVKSP